MTIQLLINKYTQIVDYGVIGEDETTYTGNYLYGTLPKYMFEPWHGIVTTETLPEGFSASTINDYVWEAETQSIVEKVYPADENLRAQYLAQCLTDFDSFYDDLMGRRANVLLEEEKAARDFVAALYTGTVPDYVSTYALHNPNGPMTDQQAADAIIVHANTLRNAQKAMHLQRQTSQADMRAATTADQLQAAIDTWNNFVLQKRIDLNLPTGQMYMSAMAPAQLA